VGISLEKPQPQGSPRSSVLSIVCDWRFPWGRVVATYIRPESIYQVRGNRGPECPEPGELSRGHRYAVAPLRGGPL